MNPHSAERAGRRVKTSAGLCCMEIGPGGTITVYTGAATKKKGTQNEKEAGCGGGARDGH